MRAEATILNSDYMRAWPDGSHSKTQQHLPRYAFRVQAACMGMAQSFSSDKTCHNLFGTRNTIIFLEHATAVLGHEKTALGHVVTNRDDAARIKIHQTVRGNGSNNAIAAAAQVLSLPYPIFAPEVWVVLCRCRFKRDTC